MRHDLPPLLSRISCSSLPFDDDPFSAWRKLSQWPYGWFRLCLVWRRCAGYYSLQNRRNFGERVLSNFITNIIAAIFDFNGSGRLGRGNKFIPRGRSTVKNKEGEGIEIRDLFRWSWNTLKNELHYFLCSVCQKYLFRSTLLRELFILSRQSPLGPFSSSQNFVIRKPRWSNLLLWIQLILVGGAFCSAALSFNILFVWLN